MSIEFLTKKLESFLRVKNDMIRVFESPRTDDGYFIALKINSRQIGRIRIPTNLQPQWEKNVYDEKISLSASFEKELEIPPDEIIKKVEEILREI